MAGQFIENGADRAALAPVLDDRLHQLERLCGSIAVLGELTNRGLDVVSGLGERMSAPLLAAVLRPAVSRRSGGRRRDRHHRRRARRRGASWS
ncbi:MAG: hypothetical protein R2838_16960 [Caldilineaceae bacterium]